MPGMSRGGKEMVKKYAIKGTSEILTTSNRDYTHAVVCWDDKRGRLVRLNACGSYTLALKAIALHNEREGLRIVEIEVV